MKAPGPETDTAFDLGRYRQAADVAYRYAKDKIEKERSSKDKEEEPFSSPDKKEF